MGARFTPGPWRAVPAADGGGDYGILAGAPTVAAGAVVLAEVFTDIEQAGERSEQTLPNARLIAAAPELLEAQTMGNLSTPEFLEWLAHRLVYVYGESPNVDFVLSLQARAKASRAAIAKAVQP